MFSETCHQKCSSKNLPLYSETCYRKCLIFNPFIHLPAYNTTPYFCIKKLTLYLSIYVNGFTAKFPICFPEQQKFEEGRRTQKLKFWDDNIDKDNSLYVSNINKENALLCSINHSENILIFDTVGCPVENNYKPMWAPY